MPQVQSIDHLPVAIALGSAQVIEQAPALGHHLEEAAARGVILGVGLEVFGQLRDPAGQQRDLNVSAAGVLFVQLELLEIHRFRALCHNEGRIVAQECQPATSSLLDYDNPIKFRVRSALGIVVPNVAAAGSTFGVRFGVCFGAAEAANASSSCPSASR